MRRGVTLLTLLKRTAVAGPLLLLAGLAVGPPMWRAWVKARPDVRLLDACSRGDPAAVRAALQAGADLNAKDGRTLWADWWDTNNSDVPIYRGDGRSPLMMAAGGGNVELARLLLSRGANVEARDEFGDTALTYAVEKHNLEIATLLVDRGAQPNSCGVVDRSPTMTAASWGDVPILKMLLDTAGTVKQRFSRPSDLMSARWSGSSSGEAWMSMHGTGRDKRP
jgi:uncharacterized protein